MIQINLFRNAFGKVCTKCNKPYFYKDFGKKKNRKDGCNSWCVNCEGKRCRIKGLKYFNANKEKCKNQRYKYVLENKIKCSEIAKKSYYKNKARVLRYKVNNKDRLENAKLLNKYNITLEDYKKMSLSQAGRCYICKQQFEKLQIDHNHITNKVRKLLCGCCNRGIGMFKENIEFIENAIKYLKEHNEA